MPLYFTSYHNTESWCVYSFCHWLELGTNSLDIGSSDRQTGYYSLGLFKIINIQEITIQVHYLNLSSLRIENYTLVTNELDL